MNTWVLYSDGVHHKLQYVFQLLQSSAALWWYSCQLLTTCKCFLPSSCGLNTLSTLNYFFFVSLGGLKQSPLGTSATNWSIVPALDDRWVRSIWWYENWWGKPKYSEKTCTSATLATTNLTWLDLGSNLGSRRLTALSCLINYVSYSVV
jgi:hypothetical protein